MRAETRKMPMESQVTVLVVDDEPLIREIVRALLEDEGYAVECAEDGVEALAVVEAAPIDLVISDVVMPRLDGRTLAQRLRARRAALPIVLMSANRAASGIPGIALMPKPFDLDDLLDAVATALAAAAHAENGHESGRAS
jgi:CheY-like chemotaxis protein